MTVAEILSSTPLTVAQARRIARPVAGPYRVETEDWMLVRALNDASRNGTLDTIVLVDEPTDKNYHGGKNNYDGVSIWRRSPSV